MIRAKLTFSAIAIAGSLIAVFGVALALAYSSTIWYTYFVLGLALSLGGVNALLKTTLC